MSSAVSSDSDTEIIDSQWISFANHWIASSSVSVNQVIEVAQKAFQNTKNSTVIAFHALQDKVAKTALSPVMEQIQSICTDVEKIFNIAGCTPWIGVLSGTMRVLFGQAETIAGVALAAISEVGLLITTVTKSDATLISKWGVLSKLGIELTIHGCLNIMRGTGELLIGNYTLGLGNVILLIPNLSNQRNFAPYFPYGSITNHLATTDKDETSETIVSP